MICANKKEAIWGIVEALQSVGYPINDAYGLRNWLEDHVTHSAIHESGVFNPLAHIYELHHLSPQELAKELEKRCGVSQATTLRLCDEADRFDRSRLEHFVSYFEEQE